MLNHATAQIFVCLDPVDMRKSFDTLAQVVRDNLGQDPLSGAWFIFRGKARDRLKIGIRPAKNLLCTPVSLMVFRNHEEIRRCGASGA